VVGLRQKTCHPQLPLPASVAAWEGRLCFMPLARHLNASVLVGRMERTVLQAWREAHYQKPAVNGSDPRRGHAYQ